MQQTQWVVITGGPCSGKTTLLTFLKNQGHFVIPEAARILIDSEIAKGRTLAEIRANEEVFQEKVLRMKMEFEEEIPPGQLTFFDRGIPDTIAYSRLTGEDSISAFQASKARRYKAVFLLEQVPFEQDYARTENQGEADQLNRLLYEAYIELGYEIINVPLMSIEDRTEFVLGKLKF